MHDNERFAMFPEQVRPSASKTPTFDQMGIDLTAQARQGKLTPAIGRDKDLERVIQVLSRSPLPRTGIRKNNLWIGVPRASSRPPCCLLG
jgi:ATP-dependent Clp protease ATP-binding subunit ClpA